MPDASIHSKLITENPRAIRLQNICVDLLEKILTKGEKPTKLNTASHNTHELIDIRDRVLAKVVNKDRKKAIESLMDIIIVKQATCGFYSDLLDDVLTEWVKSDWVFKDKDDNLRKKQIAEAMKEKDFKKVLALTK